MGSTTGRITDLSIARARAAGLANPAAHLADVATDGHLHGGTTVAELAKRGITIIRLPTPPCQESHRSSDQYFKTHSA